MASGQSNAGGWILDCGFGDEVPAADFIWASPSVDDPTVAGELFAFDPICKDVHSVDNSYLKKRTRVMVRATTRTKARREKMRRDRLNDRFSELSSILDPGKPPKADKFVVLGEATRLLNQLRLETQDLKESNEALKSTIKILKEEKSELRDEKQKLKAEKERMEETINSLQIAARTFIPQNPATIPIAFQTPYHLSCNKTLPYPSYPPLAVWQWIPPAALDTSQDHVLRSPVA